jgi:repressor LexA
MIKLTDRQAEILDYIRRHIATTGFPPTRADIAKELGFKSPNAAQEHLKALAKKGAIEMTPDASRGIRIPHDPSDIDSPGIPIVGRVSAGSPIMSEENIEDYCELPPRFFRPAADYLLHVKGESMKDIGIMDGDLLAVHSTKSANEGDVIVARVDDEVTVKRLKFDKEKHLIYLMAENEDYEPIIVDLREQQFFIEGISVGVIRRNH